MSVFLVGCLDFGTDVDLQAPNVSTQHLQEVTRFAGIKFPNGSVGIAYLYLSSGIDEALAAKVTIPEDKKGEFLQNEIFEQGTAKPPSMQVGSLKPWWKINGLTDRRDRTLKLPNGRVVECTLGVENEELVAYISCVQP